MQTTLDLDTQERPKLKKVKTLPEGWKDVLLDSVAKRGSGHTPNKKEPAYYNGGIKWVSLADSENLDKGSISETKIEISEEGIKNSSAVLHPAGTVLLSRDAGVGKSAVMACDMAVSQHFITWACGPDLHNWFLYYYLQLQKPEFERIAVGSTIKTIGLPYFKKYKIPLPPLAEQLAIANLLDLWDRGINKIKQILKAKNKHKEVLNQYLLSGSKRFKEYSNKWQEVVLGDLGYTYGGLAGKTKEHFGEGFPYINYLNVFTNNILKISKFELVKIGENEKQNQVKYGDILFTVSSETPEEVGMSAVLLEEVERLYLNSFCFGLRLHDFNHLQPIYAAYLFRSKEFRKEVIKLAQGSTRFNISKNQLLKIKLYLPSVEEQIKIASVLQAADREVEALNQKLEALKLQKKILMQKLLTGQVCVKTKDLVR